MPCRDCAMWRCRREGRHHGVDTMERSCKSIKVALGVPLGAPGGRGWRQKGESCIHRGYFPQLGIIGGCLLLSLIVE